jgi:hypothetical protein
MSAAVIPSAPASRAVRAAWIAAAVIATSILLMQAEIKALRSIGNDFTAYLAAARALAAQQSPYDLPSLFPYLYPLTLAWLLIPFLLAPVWLSAAVWYWIAIASFAFVVRGSAAAAGAPATRWQVLILCMAIGVALVQIVQNELLNGQVNLVVAALSIAAVQASERRAPVRAAALWGLAVAIKLFPLILVPWFVLRGRWGALALGLAAAAVLSLLPVLWTGPIAIEWTAGYFNDLAAGRAMARPDWIHLNLASIIGHLVGFARTPLWLAGAVAAALVGGIMLLDWRTRGTVPEAAAALLYLLLVVLVSPKSETHHMVFTIPAVVALSVQRLTKTRLAGLGLLAVVFNVGFEVAAVRDAFLLLYVVGTGAWYAHDLARR